MAEIKNVEKDKVLLIGMVGPTCSGKTTASDQVSQALGEHCQKLSQDNYYFGGSAQTNYDVLEALDFELAKQHLKRIKAGETVEVPDYDFSSHSRKEETNTFTPTKAVVFEGILLFCDPDIVDLLDIKVYIQSNADHRKARRIHRDTRERGREKNEVIERYERDVEPSNRDLVEPSRRHADIILIDNCDFTFQGMDKLITTIHKKIGFTPGQLELEGDFF